MSEVLEILSVLCFFGVLAVAVWQDIRMRKIKNALNVTGVVLGIFFSVFLPGRGVFSALVGVIILLAAGILCWKLKVFRAGDAKLLCVTGAFFGWKMGINILLLSVIYGAVLGLPLVIRRLLKKEKGLTKFPFSIAIALAGIVGVVFGYVWEWGIYCL